MPSRVSMLRTALLLLACCCVSAARSELWLRLETRGCLPDSLAAEKTIARYGTECLVASDSMRGLLVVQFDSSSGQCSIFQYVFVCHLIDSMASGDVSSPLSCAAFANARAADFMRLSRKLASYVGAKLRAAWVMSDDEEASKSNLVCGETWLWQSEAIEFRSDGAKFNGESSRMWLENVEFANLRQGLTWLVRVKREATRESTLMETYNCDTKERGTAFWDGSPTTWGLYFFRHALKTTEYLTGKNTTSFDPSIFVEVGVTSDSLQSRSFYTGSEFVPDSLVYRMRTFERPTMNDMKCLSLGFRNSDSRLLNGTVRSVAILNGTMTEVEIKSFFDLLR